MIDNTRNQHYAKEMLELSRRQSKKYWDNKAAEQRKIDIEKIEVVSEPRKLDAAWKCTGIDREFYPNQRKMQIKIKRDSADVKIPTYGTPGAACFDIAAYMPEWEDPVQDAYIPPGGAEFFRTGLSFEVPEGHVMLAFSRSGHGFKDGVRLVNCVGVIDSDYRGELGVKLRNDSRDKMFKVSNGDRIAQAMIIPIEQVAFVDADELSETERGENGYGSTGVQ